MDLTPNQVVAYNLRQARALRGWTQDQAAEALEPHLGERWSRVVFSAAERSVSGQRVRQFTADDLVAFARAFNLPVTWFLLPPAGPHNRGDATQTSERAVMSTPAGSLDHVTALELVFPADVASLVDEIGRRASLQVDGDTDGARTRAALDALRDHVVALTLALAGAYPAGTDLRALTRVMANGAEAARLVAAIGDQPDADGGTDETLASAEAQMVEQEVDLVRRVFAAASDAVKALPEADSLDERKVRQAIEARLAADPEALEAAERLAIFNRFRGTPKPDDADA